MKKCSIKGWCFFVGMTISQVVIAARPVNKPVFSNIPFKLVQQHGGSCLAIESKDFELDTCIYNDPLTGRCYPRNRAVMKNCVEGAEGQNWFYAQKTKHLQLSGYPKQLCLTRMVRSVELQPCIKNGNIAQQWQFTGDGLLKSLADTKESGSFLYAIENRELTFFHLKYQLDPPNLGKGQCYLHPVTGAVVCAEKNGASSGKVPQENDETEPGLPPEDGSTKSPGDEKNEQEPPRKPKPRYWLSERLTPWLFLEGTGKRCLSVMLPDGCSPSPNDEESRRCVEGASVNLTYCGLTRARQWRLDLQTQKIYNRISGYDFCLTLKKNGLFMEGCYLNANDRQRWYFSQGGRGSYGQEGFLRTRLHGLQTPYLYTEYLRLPEGKPSSHGWLKYEIVPNLLGRCFYHPVTGKSLGGWNCK